MKNVLICNPACTGNVRRLLPCFHQSRHSEKSCILINSFLSSVSVMRTCLVRIHRIFLTIRSTYEFSLSTTKEKGMLEQSKTEHIIAIRGIFSPAPQDACLWLCISDFSVEIPLDNNSQDLLWEQQLTSQQQKQYQVNIAFADSVTGSRWIPAICQHIRIKVINLLLLQPNTPYQASDLRQN